MQDILNLGNEARMNTPGVADGNWTWRVGSPHFLQGWLQKQSKLAQMVTLYGRTQDIEG